MCVCTVCVCVYMRRYMGGHCCHLSEPRLLRLSAGSAAYLWKAFFVLNQSLSFYKIISTEA